jgi:hypothetical protein
MTGKGQTPTYEKCDDWGMAYYCFTHIIDNELVRWVYQHT